jgi:hypothetical protein
MLKEREGDGDSEVEYRWIIHVVVDRQTSLGNSSCGDAPPTV